MTHTIQVAVVAAVLCPGTPPAASGQTSETSRAAGCDGPLSTATVVRCAVAASAEVQRARHSLSAVAGRRVAAGVWLPSHPVVAATLSRRRTPEDVTAVNWSVTLSQELEIAGQRGARVAAADAEAAAAVRRLAVIEQEVAAMVLGALLEAAAASEALRLADALAGAGRALATVAEGR